MLIKLKNLKYFFKPQNLTKETLFLTLFLVQASKTSLTKIDLLDSFLAIYAGHEFNTKHILLEAKIVSWLNSHIYELSSFQSIS